MEWTIIEWAIDIVFFFDMIFSFFSAYYNKQEGVVSNRKIIALGYLRSWFIFDLIGIFPMQFFTNNLINQMGKMARLPRVYKLMKTAK